MQYKRFAPEEVEARFAAEVARTRKWNARCKARRDFLESATARVGETAERLLTELSERNANLHAFLREMETKLERAKERIHVEQSRIEQIANAVAAIKNAEIDRLAVEADLLFPDLKGKALHSIAYWDPSKVPTE